MPTSTTIPETIVVSRDRHRLQVRWSDGYEAHLSADALRRACRCAWCTRDRILDRFDLGSSAISVVAVEALGSHGLHAKFDDGHERGIYPWAYLRDLSRQVEPSLSEIN